MSGKENSEKKPKRNWAVRIVAIVWIAVFMVLLPIMAEGTAYSYYSNPVEYSERTGIGVMDSQYVIDWANGKYDETYYEQKATELKEKIAWFIGVPCLVLIGIILVVPADTDNKECNNIIKE